MLEGVKSNSTTEDDQLNPCVSFTLILPLTVCCFSGR